MSKKQKKTIFLKKRFNFLHKKQKKNTICQLKYYNNIIILGNKSKIYGDFSKVKLTYPVINFIG